MVNARAAHIDRPAPAERPVDRSVPGSEAHDGVPTVIVFPTEVDLRNGDDLLRRALRLLETGVPGLVLDLTGCRFCDSSGPNAIFRAQVRADRLGTPLVVVLPPAGIVRRVCDIAGVTRHVATAPDLDSARSSVTIAHSLRDGIERAEHA